MGPTWVLSVTDGPHVGPMNLCGHGVLPWYRKHYWIKWQCITYFLISVWRQIWKLRLNWCRLLIGKFLWYSSASICVVTTLCDEFEKDNSRITATLYTGLCIDLATEAALLCWFITQWPMGKEQYLGTHVATNEAHGSFTLLNNYSTVGRIFDIRTSLFPALLSRLS